MSASTDMFDAIAPELADSDRRDTFLELAAARLTSGRWGSMYVQAVCYLAAHMLTLSPAADDGSGASRAAGPVTSKGAGDLSIAYGSVSPGTISMSDAALLTTPYGREFLAIRNTRSQATAGIITLGS